MNNKNIAVICNGKEISYGLNLLRLFLFKDENVTFLSAANYSAELYSAKAFEHSVVSKKTIKVFVGNKPKTDLIFKSVFNKYGMAIMKSERDYVLIADEKPLLGDEYIGFISFSNQMRNEYFQLENEYTNKILSLNSNWIAEEFKPILSKSLFANKTIKQQQYDSLAFTLYVYFFVAGKGFING